MIPREIGTDERIKRREFAIERSFIESREFREESKREKLENRRIDILLSRFSSSSLRGWIMGALGGKMVNF